jgi:hypothetical protein
MRHRLVGQMDMLGERMTMRTVMLSTTIVVLHIQTVIALTTD